MFRYGSKDETDTKKCEEDEVLQTYHKQIKLTEFVGAIFSLVALISILILWQIDEFDVGTVPEDMREMRSWWQKAVCTDGMTPYATSCCYDLESSGYGPKESRSCMGYPIWNSDFAKDRHRVQQWMNASNFASEKKHCGSDHDACKDHDYTKFMLAYDNTPKYPATVWLYDLASFRWQNQPTTPGWMTNLTTRNSMQPQEKIYSSEYPELAGMLMSMTDTRLQNQIMAQCDNKYNSYHVSEKYNDYSYAVQDRVINNYKVNMWGLLVFIYLTSFLFQMWRAYEYGFEYRPLQADGVRWVEYGITAPLMIFVIAISAGIREVSLLLILVFAQATLMGLGYVLESFQDEYLLWAKYCMYARVQGGFSTGAAPERVKLRFGAEDGDPGSTKSLVGGQEKQTNVPTASPVTTIDDFLEVIQRPGNCVNNRFNLLSKISSISSKKRMVLDVFYLLAFTLFGVIWTIILVHLIRASYVLDDCSVGVDANVPLIVWFIVVGQALMFLSFGVVSAFTWLFRVKPLHNKFKNTSDLDGRARESIKELRQQGHRLWAQASWYYALLNIVSKTYLEVTIFFYVAMFKSSIST